MNEYRLENNESCPDAPTGLLTEIESSIEYLIDLGDQYNLNMDEILNHKAKNGHTLFTQAAYYSEKVAKILIQRNVKVNTVDDRFMTPIFRVSKRFLIVLLIFNLVSIITTKND